MTLRNWDTDIESHIGPFLEKIQSTFRKMTDALERVLGGSSEINAARNAVTRSQDEEPEDDCEHVRVNEAIDHLEAARGALIMDIPNAIEKLAEHEKLCSKMRMQLTQIMDNDSLTKESSFRHR